MQSERQTPPSHGRSQQRAFVAPEQLREEMQRWLQGGSIEGQRRFRLVKAVLEPGGGIEMVVVERDRKTAERVFREMHLNFREERITPLDLCSDFVSIHYSLRRDQPLSAPVKYVLEKSGGVLGVDRRSFLERIPEEARKHLRY
ncbi:MAG: hypothetical protein V1703_04085 [Candidatus Altiarchaeota archaeon]